MRIVKTGVTVEEGRPLSGTLDGPWGPYKLWRADLYICPECGFKLVAGFANHNFAEHFEPDYQEQRAKYPPLMTVNDCGGAKP